MQKQYLLGVFSDEHDMIKAAHELKKLKLSIYDIYTPFPVHGLDAILEIKGTRLPFMTLIGGITGLCLALYFQYWVSAVDWPINVGGKPFNSLPAFIPIAFEITVLLSAFVSVFAFLFRNKLLPIYKDIIMHEGASQDKFVIALALTDGTVNVKNISKTLCSFGACEVEIRKV